MSRRPPPSACLLLLTLLAAGCVAPGMGGVSINVATAGGGTQRVEFDSKGIIHASNRTIALDGVSMIPDLRTKTARYAASFLVLEPVQLSRVTIEDVSDDAPVTLLVDEHPAIDAHRRWKALGAPFAPDENNARFLFQLENSVRIYRVTVTTADGRTIVLQDGANFPAPAKRYFRIQMGFEKVDKR